MSGWRCSAPHLYHAVPLSVTAKTAGVSTRTVRRWLVGYRADGAAALVRSGRADRGGWRIAAELV
ncbi:MAG: helix-turn-helix domain-containing protein, partial [Actinomycetota bacterium]|nr:helix-turn-helix domain-containing protein [Actinomycetota bacterium]